MNWLPFMAVVGAVYCGWLLYRAGVRELDRHVDDALRLANAKARHPSVADEAEAWLKEGKQ